ncbi:MAG: SpoIIE family protein phosphatase [Candidatus Eremiobacteraeota bacterium]|nr:SpoIIE family protein phosphatase [Candidatus Eremiobacteraeota bacterium]
MAALVENKDQERLSLLVKAGEIFHQSLDVTRTLNNVARLAVESFADICLFDLIDERSERLFVTASAHADPSQRDALASVQSILYVEEFGVHPVVQVTRTGEPFFLPHIDEATLMRHAASRQHETYMRRFGYRSKIVVPVVSENHIFGALTFVRTAKHAEFDPGDLTFAIDLGRRAGIAVANAKQFRREQYVAETLQRAFLPTRFPSMDGLSISAHYRPGSTEADIGGDWYDAFENDDGEIVLTIGDVTGKGIEAARLMVLMRQSIRVAALDKSSPRDIVAICNRLLLKDAGQRLASAFVGILNLRDRTLRYVSAGHAPPLVRAPGGRVARLRSPSPPLGAFADVDFEEHVFACPDRGLLVLYTDGIIEIDRDAIAGEEMLCSVLATRAVMYAANSAEFIERAIADKSPRDDIAVLVVDLARSKLRWEFEASDARTAYSLRDDYFGSLRRMCKIDDDDATTCGVIFAELVGNAVRHAPGPLNVSLEFPNGEAVLHVIDKGPGFDYQPALPENLWSESGRGLFLVSALARRVEVERIPGGGSHIIVTLPVSCCRKSIKGEVEPNTLQRIV